MSENHSEVWEGFTALRGGIFVSATALHCRRGRWPRASRAVTGLGSAHGRWQPEPGRVEPAARYSCLPWSAGDGAGDASATTQGMATDGAACRVVCPTETGTPGAAACLPAPGR
jgi:hypothetical protein